MDHSVKLRQTVDALFGTGVSKFLPKDFEIKKSKKTGRIRSVLTRKNYYLPQEVTAD